jgi:hypothetical protein
MSIFESIISGKFSDANKFFEERIDQILAEKLNQKKKDLAEGITNIQKLGRTKLYRLRIRGGKVQRRKKVSGVAGYTIRKGRLTRMSAVERRRRKMGARRARLKRKSKMSVILRKRKFSLRKRKSLGLR